MVKLFYLFIIFVSFTIFPKTADMFWIPKELMFNIFGLSLIASSFFCKSRISFNSRWLGAILIYCALSFEWFFYKPLVLMNENGKIYWNLWNYRPAVNLIIALLVIKTLVENLKPKNWVSVAKLLCCVSLIYCVYSLLQLSGIDPIFNSKGYRLIYPTGERGYIKMISFLGQHTLTASLIAIISPLALMFKQLRYKLLYALSFIVVLLCNSALSVGAFCSGLVSYLIFRKKWKSAMLIVAVFITIVICFYKFNPEIIGLSGRFQLWQKVISQCKDSMIFGHGIGNLAFQRFTISTAAISAHCEPLQLLFDGGLMMVILVIGYLLSLLVRLIMFRSTMLQAGYLSGLVSFFAVSLAGFPWHIAPLALLGIIYISALETQTLKGE